MGSGIFLGYMQDYQDIQDPLCIQDGELKEVLDLCFDSKIKDQFKAGDCQ